MKSLLKIIDRIGLTLTSPGRAFDLISVEGITLIEGLFVTLISLAGFSASIVLTSTSQLNFYLHFLLILSTS